MDRRCIKHGFILILLALISGLLIPAMQIPRLGLSAHTIGVLSGTLLIAIGAIWHQFVLSETQSRWMFWAWLYAGYINWLGCLVGAITGAGKTTPVAAAGAVGSPASEITVTLMLGSVAVASFIAVGLSLWGLRGRALS